MEAKRGRLQELIFLAIRHNIVKTKKEFGHLVGYDSQSAFSQVLTGAKDIPRDFAIRLINIFPTLNIDWWEKGEGNMFTESVNKPNNESTDIATIPVIPRDLCEEQDLDKYEVVQSDDSVARSPVVQQFATYDTYYNIYNDEMAPYFLAGDKLAIAPYNQGDEMKLVNGRAYVVDTKTNGMLLRLLYKTKDGYRAVAYNERYGEEVILFDEVIRVFRVLGLIRTQF
jgi:hypothetical protein